MVHLHLGAYQGADLSRIVLDRAARRGTVSIGEARYLLRMAVRDDVERLRRLVGLADSSEARALIEAAIRQASTRT